MSTTSVSDGKATEKKNYLPPKIPSSRITATSCVVRHLSFGASCDSCDLKLRSKSHFTAAMSQGLFQYPLRFSHGDRISPGINGGGAGILETSTRRRKASAEYGFRPFGQLRTFA